MSSILYLAYPSLLKKLDYCLTKSVPDKKRNTLIFNIFPSRYNKYKLNTKRIIFYANLIVENSTIFIVENRYVEYYSQITGRRNVVKRDENKLL